MKKIFICVFLIFILNLTYASERINVLMDWYLNIDHAPILLAKQKGYFKQSGLDVNIIVPSSPAQNLQMLLSDNVDIVISFEPQLKKAQAIGQPFVQLATLIDKPLEVLVTFKNSGIKSIKDLEGKIVGMSETGFSHEIFDKMLKKKAVNRQYVHVVNLNYNLIQSLLTRRVDALFSVMRNVEVIELQKLGHDVNVFKPEDYGVKPYSELIFVIRNSDLHKKKIVKFISAVKTAVQDLKNEPELSKKTILSSYPQLSSIYFDDVFKATVLLFNIK